MNGRVHHYMRIASSTSQNCGISYFIFDDIASLAGSADARNVDPDISKKENESRYLCNKYRVAGETALWGTHCQWMNGGGTTPGERCPGTLIVKHEFGISGGDHPYIKVEHKCVDNREVTSAVACGANDNRPKLERISPNIE